jgi:hypothetical protein
MDSAISVRWNSVSGQLPQANSTVMLHCTTHAKDAARDESH